MKAGVDYDVFVIGTGNTGQTVAYKCKKAGLKVAIADERAFGGTCPQRGCDPKKVLHGIAEAIYHSNALLNHGITKLPEYSWENLMCFKNTFTAPIPSHTENDLKKANIDYFKGTVSFVDEQTVTVNHKNFKCKHIVIATGATPKPLKITGNEFLKTSEDFLVLPHLPSEIIFIGAGYIALEFAHIAARLGTKVSVIQHNNHILSKFDTAMAAVVKKASEEIGISFYMNTEVKAITNENDTYQIHLNIEDKDTFLPADMVFNTAGRTPNIDHLKLEKGNISFTEKGITVSKTLQSVTNKNIYAGGDCANTGLPLTPIANSEGSLIAKNIIKGEHFEIEYDEIPTTVFTLPNIARVGISEKEAQKNHDIEIKLNTDISNWFTAKRMNEKYYAYKILIDKKTQTILGACIVGPNAAETINIFALAIKNKLTVANIKQTFMSYPTAIMDIKSML
ncbi:dihydrolipoyl dehydrogenase family protein [Zhouia sp. PK063]|uniref:dihydrolipoyl dehydrogenase family protein n=1 Tax=Zhouia sp. PK063 TaxID=3373602 RepID=UPI00378A4CDE